jgi:hypothetical protein
MLSVNATIRTHVDRIGWVRPIGFSRSGRRSRPGGAPSTAKSSLTATLSHIRGTASYLRLADGRDSQSGRAPGRQAAVVGCRPSGAAAGILTERVRDAGEPWLSEWTGGNRRYDRPALRTCGGRQEIHRASVHVVPSFDWQPA